jgi:DNA polymerase-1
MPSVPQTEIIVTEKALSDCVAYLSSVTAFSWDHETRSRDYLADPGGALDRLQMRSDMVSLATNDRCFVIPLGMLTVQCLPEPQVFDALRAPMEDNRIKHLGWNAPFDMHAQANYDVWVQNYIDVMVMAWCLDENRSCSLKERCKDVGMALQKFDFKSYWTAREEHKRNINLKYKSRKVMTLDELAAVEKEYIAYGAEDAVATNLLLDDYLPKLAEIPKVEKLFWHLHNPAVRTLFNMERRGIRIDTYKFNNIREACKQDLARAEAAVYAEAGHHFNIGSSKELNKVLYDELQLPVYKVTAKQAASTDKEALAHLAREGHPIAMKLSEWRRISTLHKTFIGENSGLSTSIAPWGHIHASFNATGTVTGRLSSSDPNMQNIPRDSDRTYHIRSMFIPSCEDYTLIGGDQSQVELRVMADLSQDFAMCAEYVKDIDLAEALARGEKPKKGQYAKSDIHQSTADACGVHRNTAKGINFGVIYRMGGSRLARVLMASNWEMCVELGIPWDVNVHYVSEDTARVFITAFFAKYPGIKAYHKFIEAIAKQQGYVESRFGHQRRVPELYAADESLVYTGVTQCINFTIQGHVGELMKHCMNVVDGQTKPHNKDIQDAVDCLRDCRYRLFLQVHDEVLGEGPKRFAPQIANALTRIFQRPMESTKSRPYYGYRVPLVFEAKSGSNWAEVH